MGKEKERKMYCIFQCTNSNLFAVNLVMFMQRLIWGNCTPAAESLTQNRKSCHCVASSYTFTPGRKKENSERRKHRNGEESKVEERRETDEGTVE